MNSPRLTPIQQSVLDRLQRFELPRGARVLDAPCGSNAALTLALIDRGFDAIGADIDPKAEEYLGKSFARVDLNGPLPWSDQSYDGAFSTEGIEHLEDHFSFLREMRRILKTGGILVVTTPNITSLRSRVRFLGSGFFGRDARPLNESSFNRLHHVSLATFPELRYELHRTGFRLISVLHTHIKPVSYLYSVYIPWMLLYTRLAFRKEKDPAQRRRNKEIFRTLFSPSALFGESLMLAARKIDEAQPLSAAVPP